jgi:hypothetical protein
LFLLFNLGYVIITPGIACLCTAKQHLQDALDVTEKVDEVKEIHQKNKVPALLGHIILLICHKCRLLNAVLLKGQLPGLENLLNNVPWQS